MLHCRIKSLLGIVAFLMLLSCGQIENVSTRDVSQINDLALDPTANNIALVFGNAGGNLGGVATDVENFSALFRDASLNLGFRVVVVREASSTQLIETTRQYAAEIGENGTMIWFFAGHGAASGCMSTGRNCITFAPIAKAISEARVTPMKRFLMFIDTCFSGQQVNGSIAVIRDPGAEDSVMRLTESSDDALAQLATASARDAETQLRTMNYPDNAPAAEPVIFEQALVMSAARRTEESIDLGQREGGAFTSTLIRTMRELRRSNNGATIRDLLTTTQRRTAERYRHTPVYRLIPAGQILNEPLFNDGTVPVPPPAQVVPQVQAPTQDLFVALKALSGESVEMFVGAGSGVKRVLVCSADRATCYQAPRDDFATSLPVVVGERAVFKTTLPVEMTDRKMFTLIGYNERNEVSAVRVIEVLQRR